VIRGLVLPRWQVVLVSPNNARLAVTLFTKGYWQGGWNRTLHTFFISFFLSLSPLVDLRGRQAEKSDKHVGGVNAFFLNSPPAHPTRQAGACSCAIVASHNW